MKLEAGSHGLTRAHSIFQHEHLLWDLSQAGLDPQATILAANGDGAVFPTSFSAPSISPDSPQRKARAVNNHLTDDYRAPLSQPINSVTHFF